mmetsp:Transcript_7556/g.11771  ORF Transcript_7556/g.11771 Transcript_7556/m.11771 type:complete len:197 (-) Transcript_7556:6-596(-)
MTMLLLLLVMLLEHVRIPRRSLSCRRCLLMVEEGRYPRRVSSLHSEDGLSNTACRLQVVVGVGSTIMLLVGQRHLVSGLGVVLLYRYSFTADLDYLSCISNLMEGSVMLDRHLLALQCIEATLDPLALPHIRSIQLLGLPRLDSHTQGIDSIARQLHLSVDDLSLVCQRWRSYHVWMRILRGALRLLVVLLKLRTV